MTKKLDSQPHGVVVYVHFKGLERSMEVGNGTDKCMTKKSRHPAPRVCCTSTL